MADNILRIHGLTFSPTVRTVEIFCRLNNIPYEFVQVDLAHGEHKSPEFLAMKLYSQVPVITHGNFSLGESGAIIYYLAEAFHIDSQWFPAETKARAIVNSILHWNHTNTVKNLTPYVYDKVIGPKFLDKPPLRPEVEAEMLGAVNSFLASLDVIFATNAFVAKTAQPSIADVLLYSYLVQLEMAEFDFTQFVNLTRWREQIGSIDAVYQVHEPVRKAIAHMVAQE